MSCEESIKILVDNIIHELGSKRSTYSVIYVNQVKLMISGSSGDLIKYLEESLFGFFAFKDCKTYDIKYNIQIETGSISPLIPDLFIKYGMEIVHYSPSAHEVFKKRKLKIDKYLIYLYCDNKVLVVDNGVCIFIIISELSKSTYKEVKRLLREQVLYGNREAEGEIPLHAGAFVFNNLGFMVMGNKGSGKTSTILSMLDIGANFVSNDLVFVKEVDNKPYVVGTPESIRIGIGTLKQHPTLSGLVPKKYEHLSQDSDSLWSIPSDEKIELEWFDLHKHFNTEVIYKYVPLDFVIFPVIKRNADLEVNQIDEDCLLNYIRDNNLSVYRDASPGLWLDAVKSSTQRVVNQHNLILDKISKNLRGYEIVFNGNKDLIANCISMILEDFR